MTETSSSLDRIGSFDDPRRRRREPVSGARRVHSADANEGLRGTTRASGPAAKGSWWAQ